jgi:hypothetical protein
MPEASACAAAPSSWLARIVWALRENWPLYAALGALWTLVAVLTLDGMYRNGGRFIYALDDPYIHMAIAKNLVRHGLWGVSPYRFSWCSSSPLWTAIVALSYALLGVNAYAPFVLNLIFATATCVAAAYILKRYRLSPRELCIALLLLIGLTPLPMLVLTGQEHCLHCLVAIVYLYLATDSLARDDTAGAWKLIVLAPILTAARYEGLAMVAIVAGLSALRGRPIVAVLMIVAGAAPVAGLGLWASSHGWYPLPNSILIKSNMPIGTATISRVVRDAAENVVGSPGLVVLALIATTALYLQARTAEADWRAMRRDRAMLQLIILFGMIAAHLLFARGGQRWFFRYEAYLFAAGTIALASCLHEGCWLTMRSWFSAASPRIQAAVIVVCLMLVPRALFAIVSTPRAMHDIYQQQYQMARFVERYYNHQAVGLNDIGAVDYCADIHLVDYAGLANMEVADALIHGGYGPAMLARIANAEAVRVVIGYEFWLSPRGPRGLPPNWIKVGEWTVVHKVVLGGPTVSFYAIGEAEAARLRAALVQFDASLPRSVIVTLFDAAGARVQPALP